MSKFERIGGAQLDMNDKYSKVLLNYSRDLEAIRKLYQKQKSEPVIPRNLPPIAGKIAWARQLYRKIENPMKVFKTKPEILKVGDDMVWSNWIWVRNIICGLKTQKQKFRLNKVNDLKYHPKISIFKGK